MKKKTVNFIEAVNSGKRFRTKDLPRSQSMSMWFTAKVDGFIFAEDGCEFKISNPEFFKAQFELEDEKITVLESEVVDAKQLLQETWRDMVTTRESGDCGNYPEQELEKKIKNYLRTKWERF